MANGRLYQLNHSIYCCRYHLVWTPRYRGNTMSDGYIKQEFKRIFKIIAKWKGFIIHDLHIADDHIHLYLTIPPKFSVAYAICIIKGKSSAWIKKTNKKLTKGSFWARGYFVSTIGITDDAIRKYIANQETKQLDQPLLF